MSENGLRELDRRIVIGDKLTLMLEEEESTRQYLLTLKTYEGKNVHVFTKQPDSAWFGRFSATMLENKASLYKDLLPTYNNSAKILLKK